LKSIVNTGFPHNVGCAGVYRFGFNGQEKDNEVYGDGNTYDFGARIYNARLGRFATIDLFHSRLPYESNYIYSGNSPIYYVDFNGMYKVDPADLKTWKNQYPLLLSYLQNNFENDVNKDKPLIANLSKETKISTQQLKSIFSKTGPIIGLFSDNPFGAIAETKNKIS